MTAEQYGVQMGPSMDGAAKSSDVLHILIYKYRYMGTDEDWGIYKVFFVTEATRKMAPNRAELEALSPTDFVRDPWKRRCFDGKQRKFEGKEVYEYIFRLCK